MKPKFTAIVVGKTNLATNTLAFRLKPEIGRLKFIPGQYVGVWLPGLRNDPMGSVRSFSIVNQPGARFLEIAFREGSTPYKKALQKLKVGSKVTVDGPYGQFTLHDDPKRPALFVAGGIGIAPVVSIVGDPKNRGYKMAVLYSEKTPGDAVYTKDLERLKKKQPKLNVVLTMTRDPKWPGQKGRINSSLIKKHLTKNSIVYLVGKPDMVADIKKLLAKLKVKDQDIKTEIFTGY